MLESLKLERVSLELDCEGKDVSGMKARGRGRELKDAEKECRTRHGLATCSWIPER